MHGVILGINLHDYKSELKIGDLVTFDDGHDDFYILEKIYNRYGDEPNAEESPLKYYVRSHSSDVLINFERFEISKAHIAFFDYDKYYNENKKILLGYINNEDINHIKGKLAVDYEIAFSEFDTIKMDDILGLDFEGIIINKTYELADSKQVMKYFSINKPE